MQSRLSRAVRPTGLLVLGIVLSTSVVNAQSSVDAVRSLSLVTRALISGVVTLLAGGAFFVFAPDTAESTMERARSDPLGSFGWGLGVGIFVIIVGVILAMTGVGLLIAVPLLIVFAVVELAAQAVVFVLVVSLLFDSSLPIERALVGAAVFAAIISAIPILGPLVSFVAGSIGLGAVIMHTQA